MKRSLQQLIVLIGLFRGIILSSWDIIRCPVQCRCYSENNMNIMDCSNSSMEQFPEPKTIPNNLQLINMSRNCIHSIPDSYQFWFPQVVLFDISYNHFENMPNFGGFYRLKGLNLAHNRIKSIPEEVFAHLNYLEELNLAYNRISHISKNAFKNLTSLRHLDLSGNRLESLPQLLDAYKLRELILNDNFIKHIPSQSLNFPNLRTLSLAKNAISHLEPKSLENCQQLEVLNLAYNPFPEIPPQMLHSVGATLLKLNLSSTSITTIRSGDFVNLLSIKEIDLTRTKMTAIHENSFLNLPKLSELHLNDNLKLNHIDSNAFRLLPSISVIYLHNCNLSGLHDLTVKISSLKQLTLCGNSFICDCNLKWLQRVRDIVIYDECLTCVNSTYTGQVEKLNLISFLAPEKCTPRIVNLATNVSIMEGQRLVLNCDTFGNPKPSVQWRNPSGTIFDGRYLIFEQITTNHSGIYRCLASSDEGLATAETYVDVIPRLQLKLIFMNSTTAMVGWSGKLSSVTSKLQFRFRDNSTEFVEDAEVGEAITVIRLYRNGQLSKSFELCLMDGVEELTCENINGECRSLWDYFRISESVICILLLSFMFALLIFFMRTGCDKLFIFKNIPNFPTIDIANDSVKLEKNEGDEDKKDKVIIMEGLNNDFSICYKSTALAAEILSRTNFSNNIAQKMST